MNTKELLLNTVLIIVKCELTLFAVIICYAIYQLN